MQKKLARAIGLYQAGDHEAALGRLASIADKMPFQGWALKGNIHAKRGENRQAGRAFLEAAKRADGEAALFGKLAASTLNNAKAYDELYSNSEYLLSIAPGDVETLFLVIKAMEALEMQKEAADLVYKLDPANPQYALTTINILRGAGRREELSTYMKTVMQHHPEDPLFNGERMGVALEICDFDEQEICLAMLNDPQSDLGRAMFVGELHHRRLMWTDDEMRNALDGYDQMVHGLSMKGQEQLPRRNISPEGQPLRIAYLSCDFYNHATMILINQVFLAHDPKRFEIALFCYTSSSRVGEQKAWPDNLQKRLHSVRNLNDREAAEAISSWKADILVDLKGYTSGARLGIVYLSDAPVKATWIGYPGPVPDVDLDYAISDAIVTPDALKPAYTEKLCRLPETYQANDCISRPLPQPQTRADHGLPEDCIVFASFNSNMKITRKMIRLWAEILSKVPGSVFWCMCRQGISRANILREFADNGIGAQRILFADNLTYARHINRAQLADLVLDTWPCNGHTTTSDLLWAGVPVVALSGRSFASRVSESLLSAIGLSELATQTPEDYVSLAVSLANNPERLASLRAKLAQNRNIMPLFDSERFTRHLESAYEAMAARARSGLAPEHIDIEALPARETPFR
jgi:predicted O-linked N-acetylglucosamine transferase (SPINDLY family)